MQNEAKTRPGNYSRLDNQSKGTLLKDNTQTNTRSDSANVTLPQASVASQALWLDIDGNCCRACSEKTFNSNVHVCGFWFVRMCLKSLTLVVFDMK